MLAAYIVVIISGGDSNCSLYYSFVLGVKSEGVRVVGEPEPI